MEQSKSKSSGKWARFSISSLEADVAYFDARLALLDKKNANNHQLAQIKAYSELERVLTEMLVQLRGQRESSGGTSSIEVTLESDPESLGSDSDGDSHKGTA